MPNYLHRTTKEYLRSTSTPDLREPEANYIKDPDVSSVEGHPTRYWSINRDTVSLMTGAEMAAVDAGLEAARVQKYRDHTIASIDNTGIEGFQTRALLQVIAKFTRTSLDTVTQVYKDDIASGLADN
jgi:hypothetical protein